MLADRFRRDGTFRILIETPEAFYELSRHARPDPLDRAPTSQSPRTRQRFADVSASDFRFPTQTVHDFNHKASLTIGQAPGVTAKRVGGSRLMAGGMWLAPVSKWRAKQSQELCRGCFCAVVGRSGECADRFAKAREFKHFLSHGHRGERHWQARGGPRGHLQEAAEGAAVMAICAGITRPTRRNIAARGFAVPLFLRGFSPMVPPRPCARGRRDRPGRIARGRLPVSSARRTAPPDSPPPRGWP